MIIQRHGSSRFMGHALIDLKNPKVEWSAGDGFVHVKASNVRDFTADASHDYDVMISVDELKLLLAAALQAVPQPKIG